MQTNVINKNYSILNTIILIAAFLLLIPLSSPGQEIRRQHPPIDNQIQSAIIDSTCLTLNEIYVFPDVAKNMEKLLRKNLKDEKYQNITNLMEFTDRLTTDLQSISHDKHLHVRPLPLRDPNNPVQPSAEEERKQQLERLHNENFGFKKVEILPGNIGYIDFRYFAETSFGDASATAIAAMNFLAHVDAIIFDLRQNGGGSPSMIQLISSYLFDEPVHLNSFYIRKTNETQQFWTQGHVHGKKLINVPVYVLTSSFTFSGAEEFSYNIKNLKRGTIIGETTGGGAHPVEGHTFDNLHVFMSVPFGRAVNPITKTNWEGTGVEPDIIIPADQALIVARTEALKKLMEKETDEGKKKELAWGIKGLEVDRNPVTIDEGTLQTYVGDYGPRKVTFEKSFLFYQRESRPKYKLIPMGDDTFSLEGMDTFRIKFNRDSSGKVIEFVGMYSDGITDSNQKTNK
jgi:hypothetical protein